MDGVTKELQNYLDTVLSKTSEAGVQAIVEEVDKAAKECFENIQRESPNKTGGLAKSLLKSKLAPSKTYYGYLIEFKGNAPNGEPYEKIANVLNYGTHDGKIKSTRFVSKAIHKLKNLDDNINKSFNKKINI